MQKSNKKKDIRPPQHQNRQPGIEAKMQPLPVAEKEIKPAGGKLQDRIAVITGGDSGIGRAVALAFAAEGAHIVIAYYDEDQDAEDTAARVKALGRDVLLVAGDVSREKHCERIIKKTVDRFGRVDVLVNNAAVQFPQKKFTDITAEQLLRTFSVNIFAHFYLVRFALPHMRKGSCIINTTSVTAYRGSGHLVDYSATKGAIVSFTRSLSSLLADKGIRVNGVAPGPIWTPLIPATFPASHVAEFGSDVPLKRAGQPVEVATSYVFLASDDAAYITGQILHPNGGEIVNG
ncbi:glucose 1-dehydrogenase [Chitinophaga sp. 22620]|uniref:glucose 1-dehydrogenase n=1 Tax=Chitinophaga sp. 22620 TaxID=3453952 RepID=UPI003F852FF8